jgi:hypothetical protein
MRGICLNWKVVAGLAVVALGIWALAPGVWSAAAPLLIAAACPLSMVVMMLAMRGTRDEGSACATPARENQQPQQAGQPAATAAGRDTQLAALKAELERAKARQEALAREVAALELAGAPAVREAETVARAAEERREPRR